MDRELILFGIVIANSVANVVLFAVAWVNRKYRASMRSIEELEVKFEQKCARLTKLEADVGAGPTKDDIVRLHNRVDDHNKTIMKSLQEMSLSLGEVCGQLKQLNTHKGDQ